MLLYLLRLRRGTIQQAFRWFIALIAVALPLYVLSELIRSLETTVNGTGHLVFGFLVGVTILLFLTPIAVQIKNEETIDIFEPSIFVLGLLAIPYVLRPLQMLLSSDYELIYQRYSHLSPSTVQTYATLALVYVVVGLAFFLTGYYLNVGEKITERIPTPSDDWSQNRVWLVVLGAAAVSVFSVGVTILLTTGSVRLFVQEWSNRVTLLSGYQIFVFLSRTAGFAAICLLLYYRTLHPTVLLYLVFSTVLVFVFGRRAFALSIPLMFVMAYHYRVRRLHVLRAGVVGGGIFTVAAILRYVRNNGLRGIHEYLLNFPQHFLHLLIDDLGRAFDNFIILLMGVPESYSFQFGTTFLRVFTNFVPRPLWTQKPPLTVGNEFASIFFPLRNGGIPIGPFALSYLNFWIFGVVFLPFVAGVLYKSLYTFLRENVENRSVILLYVMTLVHFRKGISNNSLFAWLISIPILLFLLFALRDAATTD